MSDVHALSGAYVVDGLEEFERTQFERHLGQCPDCLAEVESLREASCLLAETTLSVPSPRLRAAVLAEIHTVRPLPPVLPTPIVRRPRRSLGLLAAAAVITVVGAAGAVTHPWTDGPSSSVDRVLEASDAAQLADTDGSTQAVLVRSAGLKQSVIKISNLPELSADQTYELWYQRGAEMVPAGLLNPGTSELLLNGEGPLATDSFAITIESEGGPVDPMHPGQKVASYTFDRA